MKPIIFLAFAHYFVMIGDKPSL